MASERERYEVVRTAAGRHVRLIGRNGRKIEQTQVYSSLAAALRSIEIATGTPLYRRGDRLWAQRLYDMIEVRILDHRL